MTFTTTGGAAFTRFAYAVSPSTGSWAIPGGQICGTTVLGLASPVTLLGFVSANGAGTGVFTANVPAAACGTRFMQVVDTLTCTTSNVILVI